MIRFISFAIFALILSACGENQQGEADAELLAPMVIGRADAPVKIIEYASMTCGHCAQFHLFTLPKLKEDYVATGKVQIEFREFPLDPWAAAASLVGRCVGGKSPKRFFAILDILFQRQESWVNTEDRMDALQKLAQRAGLSQKKFRACFNNEKLLKGLSQNKLRGEQAGVKATPSFFINNILVEGNQSYSKIREIIDGEL